MNILHLKYAASIAEIGSINKAAEELHVAQPNLSRVIKELEADLGITIFQRSAHGMMLTPEGEQFMGRARSILKQVDAMENLYKSGQPLKQRFSISVPRASYISDAFARFSRALNQDEAEIFYQETNAQQAVKNILEVGYNLGILRYAAKHDMFFKQMLDEKDLSCELVMEFTYCLVMHEDSPLAALDTIHMKDLGEYIQIAHADPYVPSMPLSAVKKEELPDGAASAPAWRQPLHRHRQLHCPVCRPLRRFRERFLSHHRRLPCPSRPRIVPQRDHPPQGCP